MIPVAMKAGLMKKAMEEVNSMSTRGSDFIKGVLLGGLVGAALGILFAPKSGKEAREDLAEMADEFLARAKDEYEVALEKSRRTYETAVKRLKDLERSAKERAGDVEETVDELAEKSRDGLEEGKGRLNKAFEAGVASFKEEKEKTV
jgi:gas vesicle protein